MNLYATFTIEVSHRLVGDVLHGHSYWIAVYVPTSSAAPMELAELQRQCRAVQESLDHRHLNEIIKSPTMEAIAEFVAASIPNVVRVVARRESMGVGVEWP